MKPINQFKQELGVETLQFNKSIKNGRQFATFKDKLGVEQSVIIATNLDKAKPIYASFNADKGVFVLCNAAGITPGDTL